MIWPFTRRRDRLGLGHCHDDALAGGQSVRLDHDRRATPAHEGARAFGIAEPSVGAGRYGVGGAQVLGEPLGALEPGRRRRRSEGPDAGAGERIDQPRYQRALRSDHHQVDGVVTAEGGHRGMIAAVEAGDAIGDLGDAAIARRAV